MFKQHLTVSDYFIILANLIPLYGVIFMDWNAGSMFIVYCLETVIIGIFNVLKMIIVTVLVRTPDENVSFGTGRNINALFLIPFFIFHYGLFVFIQTQMFFHVSNILNDDRFITSYSEVIEQMGPEGKMVLLIFVISYSLQTFYSFGFSGQYKTIGISRLMFQPYARIFVQQFVVIIGSIFMSLGAGKVFMLVFIALKIMFEVYINFDRHLLLAEEKARRKII